MHIKDHSIEKLHDPTGILAGERYEVILQLELPEDDELFREQGVHLRIIFAVTEGEGRIVQYHFVESGTNEVLDFALEDGEEEEVLAYCRKQLDINGEEGNND